MLNQNKKMLIYKAIVVTLAAPFLAVMLVAFGVMTIISTVMVYVAGFFGLDISEYETEYS